jgi:putative aldouronate transport system permease protein
VLVDILSPSHGIVNRALESVGIEPVFFLGDNDWFVPTVVVSHLWKEFGFGTVVFIAAITGIDPQLYESAQIDGAGRFQRMWHVTLPGMLPIIVVVATLSLGSVLNAGFEQIFNLYSPQVYETGDILDTLIYRIGLIEAQYGPATAIGLFKSVVSLIFISVSYFLAYRFANYRIF